MLLQTYQISMTGSKSCCRHTRFQLQAPYAVADIPDFNYRLHMLLQTYQISIQGSKGADIPYFIYWLQMHVMEYQISIMGSKCSCRPTIFHLWAPNAVADLPDFNYGSILMHISYFELRCMFCSYLSSLHINSESPSFGLPPNFEEKKLQNFTILRSSTHF